MYHLSFVSHRLSPWMNVLYKRTTRARSRKNSHKARAAASSRAESREQRQREIEKVVEKKKRQSDRCGHQRTYIQVYICLHTIFFSFICFLPSLEKIYKRCTCSKDVLMITFPSNGRLYRHACCRPLACSMSRLQVYNISLHFLWSEEYLVYTGIGMEGRWKDNTYILHMYKSCLLDLDYGKIQPNQQCKAAKCCSGIFLKACIEL